MLIDMSDPFVVIAAVGQAVDLDEAQFAEEGTPPDPGEPILAELDRYRYRYQY